MSNVIQIADVIAVKWRKKKTPYRSACDHDFEFDPDEREIDCTKCKRKFDQNPAAFAKQGQQVGGNRS